MELLLLTCWSWGLEMEGRGRHEPLSTWGEELTLEPASPACPSQWGWTPPCCSQWRWSVSRPQGGRGRAGSAEGLPSHLSFQKLPPWSPQTSSCPGKNEVPSQSCGHVLHAQGVPRDPSTAEIPPIFLLFPSELVGCTTIFRFCCLGRTGLRQQQQVQSSAAGQWFCVWGIKERGMRWFILSFTSFLLTKYSSLRLA